MSYTVLVQDFADEGENGFSILGTRTYGPFMHRGKADSVAADLRAKIQRIQVMPDWDQLRSITVSVQELRALTGVTKDLAYHLTAGAQSRIS